MLSIGTRNSFRGVGTGGRDATSYAGIGTGVGRGEDGELGVGGSWGVGTGGRDATSYAGIGTGGRELGGGKMGRGEVGSWGVGDATSYAGTGGRELGRGMQRAMREELGREVNELRFFAFL